ncbi:MAG: sodium:glutamate symporter, partial [Selenomonadaceae bacterium]|nr:sodium:glutamate symporter [Selenomonadaceae bacterium]
MFTIEFNMYQTLAVAVVMLYVGTLLKRRIQFLETFCIPSPVVGGLLFAIVSCICYTSGIVGFAFDETLKSVCMVAFFTSVGFQANIKVLRSGGTALIIFLGCVCALIFAQNFLAVALSNVLNVSPFIGLCT